jgi:hypothetical protein
VAPRALVLLALLSISSAAGAAGLGDLTPAQWREDLEHLRIEAPKVHANLFHTLSEAEWNGRIDRIEARLGELSATEIVGEIARLVAAVGDGHSELYIGPWADEIGFLQLPIRFYRFDDGIRVQAVRDEHAGWLGARLDAVGGVPVEAAVARLAPFLARDNAHYLDTYAVVQTLNNLGALRLAGLAPEEGHDATYGLVLADGTEVEARLAGEPPTPGLARWGLEPGRDEMGEGWSYALSEERRRAHPRLRHDGVAFEIDGPGGDAGPGTVRVDLDLIRDRDDRTLAELGEELERRLREGLADGSVDRLIVDLRDNGGGNNRLDLPLVHAVLRNPGIDRPDRLFVLISRHTFSAASHLVTAFETHTNATFVGEPTGASPNHYGDADPVELPNSGLRPVFSHFYWQNGLPWDRREWTAPDLVALVGWDDYIAGRDSGLPVIERYGSLPTLPEAVLAAVDSPGSPAEGAGPDPVVEVLRSFGDDPVYRYLDVAREGNRLGYRLLREGRAGDAVRVLRAAAVLHPADANGFDSLGEALVEAGDPTAAREAFERAVALDPDGRIGASSREWLRRLDEPPSPP